MLYIAAYVYDDVVGKTVVDLGCGTGRLAIGAALVGAAEAVGVDLDGVAVRVARGSAGRLGVEARTHWVVGDVGVVRGLFDTVLQNPPFGVQRRGADRMFLERALELGCVAYSLHKAGGGNREFIKGFVDRHGGRVTGVFSMDFEVPRLFGFHTEKRHVVRVDLYRLEGRSHG